MKCKDVKYNLPDFLNDNIIDDDAKKISNHLDSCKPCRKELESLLALFKEIEKDKSWQPPEEYWTSLLPRIHNRIDIKTKIPPYTRIIQIVLPAAAAIMLVILSLQLLPLINGNTLQNNQTEIKQLPSDELQDYLHQQSIVGVDESYAYADNSVSLDVDKNIVKELLQENNALSSYLNTDQEILYETINDQTADKVVAIIESKNNPSID
jgi:hypothetical protein